MKALVTQLRPDKKREKILVSDWPEPEGPTGVQVKTRTLYSGITNGTERNDLLGGNYANPDHSLPRGWGYQNVGQVIETGSDVKHLHIGDLLYLSQDHVEYCVTPEDSLLIKLPEALDPKHAALFGLASVAMRSCRNADLRMGERLLIVGAGIVGQCAAQIARTMGARITLCDIDGHRLDIARQIGAAESALNVSGDGWETQIEEGAFDAVLDAAGAPGMEDRLIRAARTRGRILLIAGRTQVTYTFNTGQIREITLKQNSHFDQNDLENLCWLVSQGLVKLEPLIQDVVPITQAKTIYDTLRDEPNQLLGTLFDWSIEP